MVITLALVFRAADRLLPLAIALGAAAIAFGFLSLVGGSLTMASIAVLPVLIGLSVDYAIQFQARFGEAVRAGSSPPRAAVEAAARGGPVIATAVPGHGGRLPRPAPVADPDGARLRRSCSSPGSRSPSSLALTAGPGDCSRSPRGRRSRGVRGRARRAAGGGSVGTRRARRRRRGRAAAQRGTDPGDRARALAVSIAAPGRVLASPRSAGDRRLGGGDADPGDLRHPPARAARSPRAPERRRAREATGVSGDLRHGDRAPTSPIRR